MIDDLQRAMELAQRQPADEQRRIAQLILEELEDRAWEESAELAAATAEVCAEVASGDMMDFEEYDRARRARAQPPDTSTQVDSHTMRIL